MLDQFPSDYVLRRAKHHCERNTVVLISNTPNWIHRDAVISDLEAAAAVFSQEDQNNFEC